MFDVSFREDRCKGCGLCVEACPKGIITLTKDDINDLGYRYARIIDKDKCIGCAFCAHMCPDIVIEIFKKRGQKCG